MQYLSKAYNYYSGINPATLSGAIDVVVVRHVDENGEVTLSGSPFHVRFGKLQVLRAGEKRVTLRLPNNPPHAVPFSMKVGETGEAFFVLETREDVPAELLTSPVVAPTGADDLPPTPAQRPPDPGTSLTQQPFGATEHTLHTDVPLGEVEFLDLNQAEHSSDEKSETRIEAASPSSILDTASSLLPSMPSIPFLNSGSSPQEDSDAMAPSVEQGEARAKKGGHQVVSHVDTPPNPLAAAPGEETKLPERDETLSSARVEERDLPKVRLGDGEGPEVVYGRDVVLDMAGYHSAGKATEVDLSGEQEAIHEQVRLQHSHTERTVLDMLERDLLLSTTRPARLVSRLTDSDLPKAESSSPSSDLPASLDALTIDESRFDRGHSEPPDGPSRPFRPSSLSRTPNGAIFPSNGLYNTMDYAWDWGKRVDDNGPHRLRSESLPVQPEPKPGKLKNVEENPYLFVLEMEDHAHTFELALCEEPGEAAFVKSRLTFQRFIEDPQLVDDPRLVVRYSLQLLSWQTNYQLLSALSSYRRSLTPPTLTAPTMPPLTEIGIDDVRTGGYGWSRWWRRGQSSVTTSRPPEPVERPESTPAPTDLPPEVSQDASPPSSLKSPASDSQSAPPSTIQPVSFPPSSTPTSSTQLSPNQPSQGPGPTAPGETQYAKTLRLSSDQLKQLNLKPGPNTITFSVSSSYSGTAVCTARIFLWDETDQIVISDIDGTITKSDALGHVFAAIGRDWTHLGIAKLYTDIANNGYKILYLTSRAIGQADTTREYLKSIVQGEYRMPEGPVVMSPDRLMASLHREVIMRKPELFKMACLRDIQRLFGEQAKEAFYAGFGNRITDAMSYRSVGIEASKIYTIDSTGVVKTELLQAAGHKGSYFLLNDLVNEVFPNVTTKFKPQFTDFNYWRSDVANIPIPDLAPPSPALSARSDSSRISVFGKIATLGRKPSKQPLLPTTDPSSRPSSPLMGPAMTSDDMSEDEQPSRRSSMPGSFEEEKGGFFPESFVARDAHEEREVRAEEGDSFDDEANFDDDILAAGEMRHVPF